MINIKKEILNLIRIYDLSRNDINTIFFTLLSITIIELLGLGVIVVALNYISSQEVFIFNVEVSNVEKIIYSLTFLLLLFIGKLFILRKLFKTQMSQVYSIYKRTFHNAISKYFTSDYMITKTYKEDNIKKILTIIGKPLENIEFVEDRPGHDFRYSMESTKIRNNLGWSQNKKIEEGLKKTIEWYLENKEWWMHLDQKILDATPWK